GAERRPRVRAELLPSMAEHASSASDPARRRRRFIRFVLLSVTHKRGILGIDMNDLFAGSFASTWATVIGSGVFHGANPAMGWLFAAALGMQRGSRKAMLWALPPIALGHAASVLLVTTSAVAFGMLAQTAHLRVAMGAVLIVWALYHHLYGHRHRVRVGMTAGFVGLALWSAAMATMHGAGLMLIPALMPICGVTGVAGA